MSGLSAQIAESAYFAAVDDLDRPLDQVPGEDVPMPYTRPMEDAAIPDTARITTAVRQLVGRASIQEGAVL